MKPRFLAAQALFCLALSLIAQAGAAMAQSRSGEASRIEPPDPLDTKLPSGKSQRDEILKADHKKNIEETQKLAQLAEELRVEIEKTDKFVLSMGAIRKAEEIEKLAKRIRGRLKRF